MSSIISTEELEAIDRDAAAADLLLWKLKQREEERAAQKRQALQARAKTVTITTSDDEPKGFRSGFVFATQDLVSRDLLNDALDFVAGEIGTRVALLQRDLQRDLREAKERISMLEKELHLMRAVAAGEIAPQRGKHAGA